MDPNKPECPFRSQSIRSVSAEAERSSASARAETAVMAALDDTGARERLVIADTTRDDAWVAADADASLSLADWR